MEKRLIRFGNVAFDRAAKLRVHAILHSGQNTEADFCAEFEDRFAKLFDWPHCIVTSSGTTAGEVLWMALRELHGLEWKGYDAILTPALSFAATANCIMRAGCEPHFVDITPDLNMELPLEPVGDQVIGVQFVANMGRTVGIDEMRRFADLGKLFFAVDACEAHGALHKKKEISHFCDAAIYSFYPAHLMTCGGEGGAICVKDARLAALCRSIKSHGRPSGTIEHKFERIGTNAKWTEMAAACALSEIEKFHDIFNQRRSIRSKLMQALKEFPLILYPEAKGETIAPHAFPLCVKDKELAPRLRKHLTEWRIEWKPLWGALTNHNAYRWMGFEPDRFPNAKEVGETGLHWGCHQGMNDDDVEYIYQVMKRFFQ